MSPSLELAEHHDDGEEQRPREDNSPVVVIDEVVEEPVHALCGGEDDTPPCDSPDHDEDEEGGEGDIRRGYHVRPYFYRYQREGLYGCKPDRVGEIGGHGLKHPGLDERRATKQGCHCFREECEECEVHDDPDP